MKLSWFSGSAAYRSAHQRINRARRAQSRGFEKMNRRVFLSGILSAVALSQTNAARAPEQKAAVQTSEPLVWPVVAKLPPGIPSFVGHTDTVPDVVGRVGTPPSLVIFTEGNHLLVLLGDDI